MNFLISFINHSSIRVARERESMYIVYEAQIGLNVALWDNFQCRYWYCALKYLLGEVQALKNLTQCAERKYQELYQYWANYFQARKTDF